MYLHTFIYMGPTDTLQNLFWLLIQLQTWYPALEGSKTVEPANNEGLQKLFAHAFLKTPGITRVWARNTTEKF